MTKSELISRLSRKIRLSKRDTKVIVDTIIEAMKEALSRGERIEIRGFGSFGVKRYDSYMGRNPKTGEKVPVPARKLPYFRMSRLLLKYINEDS